MLGDRDKYVQYNAVSMLLKLSRNSISPFILRNSRLISALFQVLAFNVNYYPTSIMALEAIHNLSKDRTIVSLFPDQGIVLLIALLR